MCASVSSQRLQISMAAADANVTEVFESEVRGQRARKARGAPVSEGQVEPAKGTPRTWQRHASAQMLFILGLLAVATLSLQSRDCSG